jgi:2-oxoglutarate ferredoxin oxidoreductase subunit beta
MSHGFNSLHGRMPSVATGALVANHHLTGIGVSGDGDTASIGIGQFKHMVRRNVPMVYIVENNGVYGLTKGQFSATADQGQKLKYAGTNPYMPLDVCIWRRWPPMPPSWRAALPATPSSSRRCSRRPLPTMGWPCSM